MAEENDVMEQIRAESIDLKINPIGMRRAVFKLNVSFAKARKQQLKAMNACNKADKEN